MVDLQKINKVKSMIQNILKDKIVSMILFSFVLIALVAADVIVLDEEALVAACFVLFVLFAYKNLGDVIAGELEDRAARIQKELQKSFDQQRELLTLQIENNQKQVSLLQEVEGLYAFSQYQMNNISEKRRQSILHRIASQANQQLRYVSMKEKEIVDSLQREAIVSFSNSVLQDFQSNTPEAIEARTRLLEEGIEQLKAS
jgi:F0F1-type ATP synthase membrane subunit b/b'